MDGECPVVNGDELQFAEVSQPGGGQFDEVTGVHHFGFLVLELYRERPAMSEELIVGTDRWNRSLEPIAGDRSQERVPMETENANREEYTKNRAAVYFTWVDIESN